MQHSTLPFKSLILLMLIALLLMLATIYTIKNYDNYAYETTTIHAKDNWVRVYSDSSSGGKSRGKKIFDETLQGFDCIIREGFSHPYCNMQNWLSTNEVEGLDLSKYKYLRIKGSYESPSENDFLRVSLRHFSKDYSRFSRINTYKYNLIEIQRKSFENEIVIDLDKLVVPHWWVSLMQNEKIDSYTDLTNIPLIELATGTHATFGEHKVRASSFEFDEQIITIEQIYEYILITWAIYFLLSCLYISLYFAFMLRERIIDEKNLIQINQALSAHSIKLEIFNKTDQLTGVLNRSGMQLKMMECSQNESLPLTVVMLDLDHFKSINDTFGHQAGDLVLSKVGVILQNFIQDDESVSRFGGEEFLILMPNKQIDMVIDRLKKLKNDIEQCDMQLERKVTTSMGVACEKYKIEFKQLIKRSDKALYTAKKNGRNCIEIEVN